MTPVVAIDGPAASGKSSTARAVARRLGFLHVDSGALYRALALVALDAGVAGPAGRILAAAEARGLAFRQAGEVVTVMLDGVDAEPRIRGSAVTAAVSRIAALAEIRTWVNARLRALLDLGRPLVLDGRDIGTAVFPDAAVKVFLTATPQVRARRRLLQDAGAGGPEAIAAEAARIAERDRLDTTRAFAPLRPAPDAVHLDTTGLVFEEQVDRIVALVQATPLPGGNPPG